MPANAKRKPIWMLAGVAVLLAGCSDTDDLLALKARAPIPKDALEIMRAKGMTPVSPIMIRIFKEEDVLEIWKQQSSGRYELVKSYEICRHSGDIGPKFKEGDRQAPEGFYYVGRHQLNPNSDYHLSFNLGFPNAYDRSHGRTGTHLMVHGDCSSAGCYAMTDHGIAEIYAFVREALYGGRQERFLVKAFPFRMTAENMARHRDHEHFEYWTMLKEGYDHFELTRTPPKVDVCEKRYVFNMESAQPFRASEACPSDMAMPASIASAYRQQQATYMAEFDAEVARLEAEAAAREAEAEAARLQALEEQALEAAAALEPAASVDGVTVAPAIAEPALAEPEAPAPAPVNALQAVETPAAVEAAVFPPAPDVVTASAGQTYVVPPPGAAPPPRQNAATSALSRITSIIPGVGR